jgi:hypothetical protein
VGSAHLILLNLINTAHKLSVDVTQLKIDNTVLTIQIKDLWHLLDVLPMQLSLQPQGLSSSWLGLKPSKEVVVSCNVASQQKSASSYADVNSTTQPCITKSTDERKECMVLLMMALS